MHTHRRRARQTRGTHAVWTGGGSARWRCSESLLLLLLLFDKVVRSSSLATTQATNTLAATEAEAKTAAKEMQGRAAELQAQLDDFEASQKTMIKQKEKDIKVRA